MQEHIDSIGHALEDESSTYFHEAWGSRRSRGRGQNTNRDAVIYGFDSSSDEYGDVRNIVGTGVRNTANNQANDSTTRGESDAFEPSEGDDKRGEGEEELTEGEEKVKAPTRIGKKRREKLRAEAEAEAEIQQEPRTVGQPVYGEQEEEPLEEETVEDSPIPFAPRVEEKTLPVVLEAWMAALIYSLTRCVAVHIPRAASTISLTWHTDKDELRQAYPPRETICTRWRSHCTKRT